MEADGFDKRSVFLLNLKFIMEFTNHFHSILICSMEGLLPVIPSTL